ncbi:MARVEL domain-containing protein 3-like isoform X1 [Petromyzon marinus]|uniref:MARVEL domain-containing protein 3-like isoform X1 n=2 Tax=Petromyzon marinus TaxID=7757 RepID=UPI003F6EDA52
MRNMTEYAGKSARGRDQKNYRGRDAHGNSDKYRDRESYRDNDAYRNRDGYGDRDGYRDKDVRRDRDKYGDRENYRRDDYRQRDAYGDRDGYRDQDVGRDRDKYRDRGYDRDQDNYRGRDAYGDQDNYTERERVSRGPPRNDRERTEPPAYRDNGRYVEPVAADPPTIPEEYYYQKEVSWAAYYFAKLKYLATRRGILQATQVLLSILSVVLAAASQSASPGYLSLGDLGGVYYYSLGYAYSGFTGKDAERLNDLDLKYNALKTPAVNLTLAVVLPAMGLSFLFIVLGLLHIERRACGWLLFEALVSLIYGLGLIPAVAFYLHYNIEKVYGTQVCKDRSDMLASRNYTSTCVLHATEIMAGAFALLLAISYLMSIYVCVSDFREARRQKVAGGNEDDTAMGPVAASAYVT